MDHAEPVIIAAIRPSLMVRLAVITTMALWCAPAASGETGGARRVIDDFTRCRQIAASEERLACFDRAATQLEQSVKSNDIRIVDRADVRKARRSLFGLTVADGAVAGATKDDEREAFTEIDSRIAAIRPSSPGRFDITLTEDGAPIWQTTEPMRLVPKPGAAVHIRKGTMGGFFMTVGGRGYRAIRLR